MKISIIGPAYPLRGGIANFNEALAYAFKEENIETNIYSFSLQYPNFLFPGKTQFDTSAQKPDLNIYTTINSINPVTWVSTAKKIIAEKPDLVIVRYWLPFMAPCLGSICRYVSKFGKIKIIAITDNVIPHEARVGDRLLTKYFIKSCDGFIAMSKQVLEEVGDFTNNPNKVLLPHPIYNIFGNKISKSEAKKHLSLNEKTNYVLFFGFIRKYKGLHLLLRSFAEKALRDANIKLIVAGEFYDNEKEYLDLIKELNLTDKVILKKDYIDNDEIKYYFCAADLVAQTYISASQSGVAQIAYNFDRPMLVTNVGGLGEIVLNNKTGFVVEKSEIEIANAIAYFYSQNLEEEFSKNTAIEKEKYSWKYFVKGITDLYRSL